MTKAPRAEEYRNKQRNFTHFHLIFILLYLLFLGSGTAFDGSAGV